MNNAQQTAKLNKMLETYNELIATGWSHSAAALKVSTSTRSTDLRKQFFANETIAAAGKAFAESVEL